MYCTVHPNLGTWTWRSRWHHVGRCIDFRQQLQCGVQIHVWTEDRVSEGLGLGLAPPGLHGLRSSSLLSTRSSAAECTTRAECGAAMGRHALRALSGLRWPWSESVDAMQLMPTTGHASADRERRSRTFRSAARADVSGVGSRRPSPAPSAVGSRPAGVEVRWSRRNSCLRAVVTLRW